MISHLRPVCLVQGPSAVLVPDTFNGSLAQMLAQLCERGGDDGAGRGGAKPPLDVASGRIEVGIHDEHRDGIGNLHMAIAPLRQAAALPGLDLITIRQHSGQIAQICARDLYALLDD